MSTPRSLELPPSARAEAITTSRLTHAAIIIGELSDDASPTAVFVPGFTGSKEDFHSVLEPLAAAGYRVIAFDQRGQYQSPSGAGDLSLDDLADDVVAVIDAVSPRRPVHLVGHSLGGLVARAATLRAHHRIASLSVVCSGPAAIPADQWGPLEALVAALDYVAGGEVTLEQVWAAKEALDQANGVEPPPPHIHEFMHQRFLSNSPAALRAKALILMGEPDRTAELAALARTEHLPLQVITGDADDVWPVAVQAQMAVRLGVEVVTVHGAGHSPAVDQPHATAAALLAHWAEQRDRIPAQKPTADQV